MVSSGDYEQYFVGPDASGGIRRYHHIIDPRTGWPADNGIAAVTIVAPSASQADALATAVLVLGLSQGMELGASLSDAHVLIVDKEGTLHWSAGMSSIFTPISQREVAVLG